jgi:hypothetical protein
MHPLYLLAFATFVLVIGFVLWNIVSVRRHRFGADVAGPGGPNDPISGKTENIRSPDEIRASLDQAAVRSSSPT